MQYLTFGRRTAPARLELASARATSAPAGAMAPNGVAKSVFDGYVAAGGASIDTADTYQVGQSEQLVGDFIAADRDQFRAGHQGTRWAWARRRASRARATAART